MTSKTIREHIKRLVARTGFGELDTEVLEFERLAQLAEANELAAARNAMLAESIKLQIQSLRVQSEQAEFRREMVASPEKQAVYMVKVQEAINAYTEAQAAEAGKNANDAWHADHKPKGDK
jgi:hypothetical protein